MSKFKNTEELEKAYQELEGEFTKKSQKLALYEKTNYVTLLNKEIDSLVDDYAKRKISNLEAKLAESEEQLKEELVEKKGLERALSACNRQNDEFADMIKKLVSEKEELKQQLAEKDEEIKRLKIYDEYRFELPYPKVKILGKTFEDIQELIDKWLKQGSKDKISFAVEQIIKTKETLIKFLQDEGFYENEWYDLFDKIDNQINELKEGK